MYLIFYLPWYLWGWTSFETIETCSTDRLHGLHQKSARQCWCAVLPSWGKNYRFWAFCFSYWTWLQSIGEGLWSTGEAKSPGCMCLQVTSRSVLGFGSYTFLKNSLSFPALSEWEEADLEHVHQGRECCNSSELKQFPTWGKILVSFYFCRLPHSLKYRDLAVKIQTASAMPKGLIVVKIRKQRSWNYPVRANESKQDIEWLVFHTQTKGLKQN